MANPTRKRVITIETREKTVIRQDSPQTYQSWCELCAAEVEMITPKSAANLLGVTQREIFRRIEQRNLHFFETETGEVFICTNPIKPKLIGDK